MNQTNDQDLKMSSLTETLSLTKDKKFYVNGVDVAASSVDVVVVLSWNGDPEALVNMSPPVAKSLAISLFKAIEALENKFGLKVYDLEELENLSTNEISSN